MERLVATYLEPQARLAIYAQGEFGKKHAKTAEGVIRYGETRWRRSLTAEKSGSTVREAVGLNCDAPIVASVSDSPETLTYSASVGEQPGRVGNCRAALAQKTSLRRSNPGWM